MRRSSVVLPRAAAAHDRDDFAARENHVDALQDRAPIVGKIDAREFDEIIWRHVVNSDGENRPAL